MVCHITGHIRKRVSNKVKELELNLIVASVIQGSSIAHAGGLLRRRHNNQNYSIYQVYFRIIQDKVTYTDLKEILLTRRDIIVMHTGSLCIHSCDFLMNITELPVNSLPRRHLHTTHVCSATYFSMKPTINNHIGVFMCIAKLNYWCSSDRAMWL